MKTIKTSTSLATKAAALVADVLVKVGRMPKDAAQLVMDRLAGGLEKDAPHTLLDLIFELELVLDEEFSERVQEAVSSSLGDPTKEEQ